jgi:RNA methyltransferase, TrmH family
MRSQPPASNLQPPITSRQHPLCKLVRSLHLSKGRRQHKLFVVEGGNGVEAALRARWPLQRVIVPDNELGNGWRELAQSSGIETQTVSEELMEYLCDAETSTDVIALAQAPGSGFGVSGQENFILHPSSFILVLDGIGDPGNVGTLVRSACAAGATHIVATQGSADPYGPKAVRASAGGTFFLPPLVSTREELITVCQSQNIPLVVAAAHEGQNCFSFRWPPNYALVLGHETRGISPELENAATARVTIPIEGKVESLNVAAAGAVLLFAARYSR